LPSPYPATVPERPINLPGDNMAYYRLYLLNETDHIYNYQIVEGDDDDAAVLIAGRLLSGASAVEIWAGARRVAHLTAAKLEGQQ